LTVQPDKPRAATCSYLPDLCAPMAVLGVVLIAELVAITLALARQSHWVDFFADLGRTSFVLMWLSLTSAAVLCGLRPRLAHMNLRDGSFAAWIAVILNVLVVSEALYWVGFLISPRVASDGWLPADHWFFAARNMAIGGIVAAGVLRYFYVTGQWQTNVRREAEARIHALQARIRPHFLFNSMNTIASLTRSNPAAAEQAVEDLADLFRASLADARQRITIEEELDIARVYQRMEQQRLGERLQVQWRTDDLPMDAVVPSLTIQPLLENAIYHGVERLAGPGIVEISGQREGDLIVIRLSNPTPPAGAPERSGNQIALDNIRERLKLAFGDRARLMIATAGDRYEVTLAFPYQP
jgi:two-component system sensor histidine kinase AlgZ